MIEDSTIQLDVEELGPSSLRKFFHEPGIPFIHHSFDLFVDLAWLMIPRDISSNLLCQLVEHPGSATKHRDCRRRVPSVILYLSVLRPEERHVLRLVRM